MEGLWAAGGVEGGIWANLRRLALHWTDVDTSNPNKVVQRRPGRRWRHLHPVLDDGCAPHAVELRVAKSRRALCRAAPAAGRAGAAACGLPLGERPLPSLHRRRNARQQEALRRVRGGLPSVHRAMGRCREGAGRGPGGARGGRCYGRLPRLLSAAHAARGGDSADCPHRGGGLERPASDACRRPHLSDRVRIPPVSSAAPAREPAGRPRSRPSGRAAPAPHRRDPRGHLRAMAVRRSGRRFSHHRRPADRPLRARRRAAGRFRSCGRAPGALRFAAAAPIRHGSQPPGA